MTAGRPLEYKGEETVMEVEVYLQGCKDEEYRRIKTEGDSSTSYDNKLRVKLPSIEGLANELKISRETVYDWERKYPEFSDIIKRVRQEQAKRLIDCGLSGDYNPTIAKVLLTKHGYRDSQELTGKDGKDLNISFDPTFNKDAITPVPEENNSI